MSLLIFFPSILYGLVIILWPTDKFRNNLAKHCGDLPKVTDLICYSQTVHGKMLILHLLSIHLCLYTCLYITYYKHIYIYITACMYIYMYIYTYIIILYIYIYIIYTYIYIYIYIRIFSRKQFNLFTFFPDLFGITWTIAYSKETSQFFTAHFSGVPFIESC